VNVRADALISQRALSFMRGSACSDEKLGCEIPNPITTGLNDRDVRAIVSAALVQ